MSDMVFSGKVIKVDSEDAMEGYLRSNSVAKHPTKQFMACPVEVLERCSYQASICYMHLLWRSNVGNVISNTALAKIMKCSTRTITNLIDELIVKGCITVFLVSKTTRYIYPNYILPTAYVISKKSIDTATSNALDNIDNGGFEEL